MLKYMKVGTKLIAVLVAPVLVLVILASIGVCQRLDTAPAPSGSRSWPRWPPPTPTWPTRSSVRPSTPPPTWPAGQVVDRRAATQRKATDTAKDTYNATEDRINPGKDSDDLKKAVAAVADRLNKLDTQRRSVDGIETETSKTIEQFVDPTSSTSGTLAALNTAIAQAAEDPTLSRGLTTYANLNRLKTAQANQAALATSFASLTYSDDLPYGYPADLADHHPLRHPLPAGPRRVRHVRPLRGLGGGHRPAGEDIQRPANASQKQLYRDSTAGKKLADYEKQITDTGTAPANHLDDSNSFVTLTAPLATSGRPASRSTRPPSSSTS